MGQQTLLQVINALLLQNEEEGMCSFLTYFIMSGYQFKQAQAVLKKRV